MALARDVPFMQYGTDEITVTAAGTCNINFIATPLTALLPWFKYSTRDVTRYNLMPSCWEIPSGPDNEIHTFWFVDKTCTRRQP